MNPLQTTTGQSGIGQRHNPEFYDNCSNPPGQAPVANQRVQPSIPEKPLDLPQLNYLLVHDWMPGLGGSETVFQEICSMFPGPAVSALCKKPLFPWLKGRKLITSWFQHLPFAFWRHYIFSPWMPEFYQNVKLEGADVVLLDSHSFAHHVPRHPHAIYLCYYHTSARALWNPEIDNRANTGRMALLRKWIAPKLKALDLAASRNPEYLIANSQTTAERVLANYGRQVDEVIYPPVDVTKWLDTRRIDTSQGFLMWGRLIDYKRVDLAIEAAKQTGYQLNIVGKGPLEAHLRALAKGSDNIIFWGRLDDDRLKELMAHCLAVLFPGYEDFGIVPVEAMAAGLPVIAYRKGGAAESVNGFGLLLEAQDANELAAKMTEIQTMWFDPQRLKENAKRFDVEIFRAKYRAAVRRAVDRFGYKIKKEL